VKYTDYTKWTNDRPGDGVGPDKDDKMEDLFKRGDVKRALKALEKATATYVKTGDNKGILSAAKDMKVSNGSEVSQDVLRQLHMMEKEQLKAKSTDGQKKVVKAIGMARDVVKASKTAGFGDVNLEVNVRDVFNLTADNTAEDVSEMQHMLFDAIMASGQDIEAMLQAQVQLDPRYKGVSQRVASDYIMNAGLGEVLNKIIRRIRDKGKAKEMGQKVFDYTKTKNDRDDLSLQESRTLYRDDDYGTTEQLSKKKKVDIGWTDHAEYRSDLRDIPPEKANKGLLQVLRNIMLPKKGKKPNLNPSQPRQLKVPGMGTMVVDYDLERNPADAKVITLWAAQKENDMSNKIASDLVRLAKSVVAADGILAFVDEDGFFDDRLFDKQMEMAGRKFKLESSGESEFKTTQQIGPSETGDIFVTVYFNFEVPTTYKAAEILQKKGLRAEATYYIGTEQADITDGSIGKVKFSAEMPLDGLIYKIMRWVGSSVSKAENKARKYLD
jgi:hypothetical protein